MELINKTLETLYTTQNSKFNAPAKKNNPKFRNAVKKMFGGNTVEEIVNGLQEEVPIYFDNGKNFWMWNRSTHVYERIDETEILCQITEHLDLTVYTKDFKNQILEGIRQTGRLRRVKPTKQEWIQFKNCVFDINTGKVFKATPDYFFVSQIPHKLGNSEETPILNKLFKDWHSEKAELLEEICAYSLLDSYPIQRIFAFIGPGGNGKGQFTTFVRRLLGLENCVGTDLDRLAESRFEASKLFKKKAAFVGETNYTLSKTSLLKSLCGGDTISGEFKGRDPFDFVNTAKIFISTNGLPVTTDRSEGFYRRWCLVEFKNTFTDGKDIINTVPEVEYENFCKKSLRVLKDILDSGKLRYEPEQKDRKDQYEKLSNPIQAFLNDECTISDELFVPVWYLYERYDIYRDAKGHRNILQNEFAKIVESMGYNRKQKWFNNEDIAKYKNNVDSKGGKNWIAFEGLGLDSRGNSRNENPLTDAENSCILENSRDSNGKSHSAPYIESDTLLTLEPLEQGIKSVINEYEETVLSENFITSRNSRINEDLVNISDNLNFKSKVISAQEAKNFLKAEGY
jgi:putative DNA primase/helicase